ncbi:MAG: glycosyltransferase family 2 protein [Alphaproteobacteria bacterium]|nr:glycosyltransferase family 2 protein [Alphaproteobacteria bacterium]
MTASDKKPDLSVVVPVFNEEENVLPLVSEITAALDGVCDYEIVYVNDGSSDTTASVLKEVQGEQPRLRIVTHKESCGQSTAVRTGVKAASAPLIATLDGDGQNDPADIPNLLKVLQESADVDGLLVAGWRAKRQDSEVKKVSSKIANGVRSRLLGDATPDTGCGLKVFSRAAFLDMAYFSHMHRFLPALMIRRGGKVVSVKVNHRHRERGVSKYGTWDRLKVGVVDLFGVRWLQRRAKVPVILEADD